MAPLSDSRTLDSKHPFACTKLSVPERVPVNTEGSATPASAGVALVKGGMATYAVTGLVSLLLVVASAL